MRKYCGINLSNDDTGAITGSDAGGDKVKNAEDIVQESGEAVYPPSNTFTIRGLTVVVPDKSTLTKAEQMSLRGFIPGGLMVRLNSLKKAMVIVLLTATKAITRFL